MKKRSKLNLSCFHNCTFKMGYAYPTNLIEVLPGDTLQMSTSVFMRLAPMVVPVMHPVRLSNWTFFVPSRVIGNLIGFDFESFITGGADGMNSETIPQITINKTNSPVGQLADAFGIPVQNFAGSGSFSVNALPFIGYYLIWNELLRDQNLQDELDLTKFLGTPESLPLVQPCWNKDYFTTATTSPQKGPAVTIPIDLSAGSDPILTTTISGNGVPTFNLAGYVGNSLAQNGSVSSTNTVFRQFPGGSSLAGSQSLSWANPALKATTTYNAGTLGTGAISVDDVRQAFALQRFEEHRSLFGSRYEDYLRYIGVRPQDARLQLPEYLGGWTQPLQFSEVLQTAESGDGEGVGDLYGHGIAAGRGRRIRYFVPEHGYIYNISVVRPLAVYSQGLERMWSKKTRVDFWQKELEHTGQQEVLNSEVYADGTADDANTFGFQNRYDEYRRGVNIVTGEFRTNQDFWTMARIFDNRPALNSDFVECNPTDRIFQLTSKLSDQLYAMVQNNVVARRLVSHDGNPI